MEVLSKRTKRGDEGMIFGQCLLCNSTEIGYQNGLLSIKVPGLQVEICLCPKHSQIARHPTRWVRVNRDLWTEARQELKELEEDYFRGKDFPGETCLLCNGSGQLAHRGECWWCKGKGMVKPEPLPAWKKLLSGVSL